MDSSDERLDPRRRGYARRQRLCSFLAHGRDNVFVTRFATTGAAVYTTDLPGLTIDTSNLERPAIAVSPAGEVAVAGRSETRAFGVPSTTIGPVAAENAVVVTLDARGALSSATVIGGSERMPRPMSLLMSPAASTSSAARARTIFPSRRARRRRRAATAAQCRRPCTFSSVTMRSS